MIGNQLLVGFVHCIRCAVRRDNDKTLFEMMKAIESLSEKCWLSLDLK